MALETFTIKKNGGTAATLSALSVVSASLTVNSTGAVSASEDSLVLTIQANAETAKLFDENDKVELFSSGTRRFIGWMSAEPDYLIADDSERQRYRIESPSRYLQSTFKQNWNDGDGGVIQYGQVRLNAETESTGPISSLTTIDLKTQIEHILDYAIANGNAGGAAPFDYDTTGIPSTLTAPEIRLTAPTCAACLEECLKWLPGISMRWDHTGTGDPVLRFIQLKTINSSTGAVLDPPTLSGSGSPVTHELANDGTIFEGLNPRPTGEKIHTVELIWQTKTISVLNISLPWAAEQLLAYETETSTISNGSIRDISIPIELRGYYFDGTDWTGAEEKPAEGLARQIHQAYARIWWAFDATTHSDDFHWEFRPGDVVNVTGASTSQAEAYSSIQTIERDLMSGTVRVQTGAPAQRGLGQFTRARKTSKFTAGSVENGSSAGQQTSGKADQKDPPGSDPGTTQIPDYQIYFMANGAVTSKLFIVADPP